MTEFSSRVLTVLALTFLFSRFLFLELYLPGEVLHYFTSCSASNLIEVAWRNLISYTFEEVNGVVFAENYLGIKIKTSMA